MTIGGLQKSLSQELRVQKDFYTLKSACELLQKLEFVYIEKKTDRTYVGLTDRGKEMVQKL